jgi:iron complex transport system permease protein
VKVSLDLTRLRREGKITAEEYDKLSRLAERDTGTLALNLLVGFGVVAVSGAALALVPAAATSLAIGVLVLGLGLILPSGFPQLTILTNICVLVGALMLAGGLVLQFDASPGAFMLTAAIFAICGVLARSGLLVALCLIALLGALGGNGEYWHASYGLAIPQPALTVLVFSAVALGTFLLSKRLPPEGERLAIIASRTALFLVNLGFWVGSLWGDSLDWLRRGDAFSTENPSPALPEGVFVIGWIIALAGVAIWAARANRRWVLNIAAVFGAIHFYTQWFERLEATPLTVLLAGLVTLGAALGLWFWNQRFKA